MELTGAPNSLHRRAMVIAAIMAATALALWLMGRTPICTCGYVKLWHGETMSAQNSQHLLDWYSPSHVLHGLVFYALLHFALSRWSFAARLTIATLVEAAWEVAENTNAVIEHYRAVTISLDYFGDSIINSMADISMMMLGFFIASRAPVWFSILLFVAAELFVGYMIRDGLILNVIMLLFPLEAIKAWQAGA